MSDPHHYSIIVCDLEGSSALRDDEKPLVRRDLYEILRRSLEECGGSWDPRLREDRGDGVYLLVPPTLPKRRLVRQFLEKIDESLGRREVGAPAMRLRLGLHSGEVQLDEDGSSGADVDRAFGMVNHDLLRAALRAEPRARMAVICSEGFYNVFLGDKGFSPTGLRRYRIKQKQGTTRVWITLPGIDVQPHLTVEDKAESSGQRTHKPTDTTPAFSPVQAGRDINGGVWQGTNVTGGIRFGSGGQ